jgi:tryptophanyl-tRNA synthetase
VPGIDGAKMSKSYNNHIPIFARGKELKSLVMSIKTDSTPLEEPKNPDTCTVFALYSLMATPEQIAELREKYVRGGYGYGHAKLDLLKLIEAYFAPAHERLAELERHPDLVEDALREGARRARAVAREVTDRARVACGVAAKPG